MKLVTKFELAKYNKNELYSILRRSFNDLANSKAGTAERTNVLASIENIQKEIGSRAFRS